jgi:hypothetical protein
MFNFKHFLARLVLAAAMIGAAGQAAAAPIYRVNIDTASLGTGSAYLGLYFLGLAGGPAATATVSDLTGALDGASDLFGSVSGSAPGPFMFSNANGGGELVQAIQLGGMFSFDVSFAMDLGSTGATFGWALFDDVQYLGANGDLGNVFLQPDAPGGAQTTLVTSGSPLGTVTVIPEPSTMALLMSALLIMLAWQAKGRRRD